LNPREEASRFVQKVSWYNTGFGEMNDKDQSRWFSIGEMSDHEKHSCWV